MATDDQQVLVAGQASAPAHYTIPGNGQIRPKVVFARYDGTATTAAYVPTLTITSDGGETVGIFPASEAVAAGASVNVSWFPGVDEDPGTSSGAGGGGTISDITSSGGTIAVASPAGPTTNLELPPSGVTAATYGDGSHVSQVQVNAEGIVTSASDVAITGLGGGMVNIFDQTLGVASATIDTGAGGVAAGYSGLMILVLARASGAFFSGGFGLQFNADAGNNYQYIWTDQSNAIISGLVSTAQPAAKVMEGPGSSVAANIFGAAHAFIPGYDQTTAYKAATSLGGFGEATGHSELVHAVSTWLNTAAITRITLVCGIGNFIAGSRLTIYGLP